jgi:hypothetical protein
MKTLFRFIVLVTLLTLTNPTQATYILVLGDDNSESFISPYLTNQGHIVTSDTSYYDWDGNIPALTEVIIYLHGYEYGNELGKDSNPINANQSMLDFVSNGGGLIFTEWYAYSEQTEPVSAMMPVTYNGDYYYEAAWNVANGYENHPLITNLLSTSFTVGDGSDDTYSDVIRNIGTAVVMKDDSGIPLLSYNTLHGGNVIHINDGMAYYDDISDEILSVINSSVLFAASNTIPVKEPPAIGVFALILLAFLSCKKLKRRP